MCVYTPAAVSAAVSPSLSLRLSPPSDSIRIAALSRTTATAETTTATYAVVVLLCARREINSPPGTFPTDMRNDWQSHGKYFYGGGHTFPRAVRPSLRRREPTVFMAGTFFFPRRFTWFRCRITFPDCTIFFFQNVIGTYAAHDIHPGPATTASRDNIMEHQHWSWGFCRIILGPSSSVSGKTAENVCESPELSPCNPIVSFS